MSIKLNTFIIFSIPLSLIILNIIIPQIYSALCAPIPKSYKLTDIFNSILYSATSFSNPICNALIHLLSHSSNIYSLILLSIGLTCIHSINKLFKKYFT